MDDQNIIPIHHRGRRRRITARTTARESSEHWNARIDTKLADLVNQILAGRLDPDIRTRSDVIHDAVALWLDEFFKLYPDLTHLKSAWAVEKRMQAKDARRSYLERLEQAFASGSGDSDTELLRDIFIEGIQELGQFKSEKASSKEIEKLQDIIDKAKSQYDKLSK